MCELSVSRLSPVQPSGAPSWEGVLRALGLPPHAAPEEVIPQLSSLFRRGEGAIISPCVHAHQGLSNGFCVCLSVGKITSSKLAKAFTDVILSIKA